MVPVGANTGIPPLDERLENKVRRKIDKEKEKA